MIVATYEAKCPVSGKLMNPPHPEYLLQDCADPGGGSRQRLSSLVDPGEKLTLSRAPRRSPLGGRDQGRHALCGPAPPRGCSADRRDGPNHLGPVGRHCVHDQHL